MMRVALIAGSLGMGGAEKQLVYMARALHASCVEVRVFYSVAAHTTFLDQLREAQVPVICYGEAKEPWKRLWTLYRQLAEYRPHIIQSSRLYTNFHTVLFGALLRAITIGSSRSSLRYEIDSTKLPFRQQIVYMLMRLPNQLLVNSEATHRQIVQAHIKPNNRVFVLPNVIDIQVFDAAQRETDSVIGFQPDQTILFVGRLVPIKRIDRALHAFSIAVRQLPNLQFVIVGDGPEQDKLEHLSQELKIHEQVHFLGRRTDIPAVLQCAGMLVLCSDQEGFPNVILEAMAARLPVVSTPVGDAPQIVVDGETGFVVDFSDNDQMADTFIRLMKQPELRSSFGQRARERVERLYSSQVLGKMLLEVYRHFTPGSFFCGGQE